MNRFVAVVLASFFVANTSMSGEFQEKQVLLARHTELYGKSISMLKDEEFIRRCELALDLLEEPLADAEPEYIRKVVVPWTKTLKSEVVSSRLGQFEQSSKLRIRTRDVMTRIKRLATPKVASVRPSAAAAATAATAAAAAAPAAASVATSGKVTGSGSKAKINH